MRIAVVGGGPAGLYFAYRWKKRHPESQLDLFEQNAANATWGFGVVFSNRAWEFLRSDDPEIADFLSPQMETWNNITLHHPDASVEIDGVGFSAIGRLHLLMQLQARAFEVGAKLYFETPITTMDQLAGYDLIVAADGLNSIVRRSFEGDFKTSLSYCNNKFAWYGTTMRFDTLSHSFLRTAEGTFNAHHYRYSPTMSTFLVECDRATWEACGFAEVTIEQSRAICEQIFAKTLQGHSLLSNRSFWRNFPWLWNDRWSFRNMVLVGDALRTAHFSIGSGTRLAMEDVIALVSALEAEPGHLSAGLKRYEAKRRPIVEALVSASKASADWYDHFSEHMRRPAMEFAMGYITRSGRVDPSRLKATSPAFFARYEAAYPVAQNSELARH
jgi:2-polyprenyl-6-methoxyphenol hydroxylase-like FAD-dependent oxidoreductase